MAEGLVIFNSDLPGGVFQLLVSDSIRDKIINNTINTSGYGTSFDDMVYRITQHLGVIWRQLIVWAYDGDTATYNQVKNLFPNTRPVSNDAQCNIGEYTLFTRITTATYFGAVGVNSISASPFEYYYSIFGNGSLVRGLYSMGIGFPVFRGREIDFENKRLSIQNDSEDVIWIEVSYNRNSFYYSVNATAANNTSKTSLLNNMPVLASAAYDTYIGSNNDPYSPGGASTHGGGGRPFDNTSDPVAIPSLPADPVLNSGFVTIYQMDVLKLNSLANFLWDASLFDVETWQKVLANPFDAIISLNYIPASPNVLSDRPIQIGNVTTNVSAAPVADQFVQIDCKTLDVEEYGGTYLDYNPYTKVEIYLPYIGFRDLNTDEVMDKTLHLIYNVDIVTGTCVANILVDNTVLYQFTGNCALSIPLTGRDAGKNFAALLSLISAGAVVGAGAYSGTLDAAGAVKAVSATAQAVMGAKRNIQRSGSVSGAAGFMGGQTPYLIITRPRQALPESQNSFTGYPSFVTENLSDLTGFTTIESIHLEGIPGTSAEIAEIESLLSSGVIL